MPKESQQAQSFPRGLAISERRAFLVPQKNKCFRPRVAIIIDCNQVRRRRQIEPQPNAPFHLLLAGSPVLTTLRLRVLGGLMDGFKPADGFGQASFHEMFRGGICRRGCRKTPICHDPIGITLIPPDFGSLASGRFPSASQEKVFRQSRKES